MNELYRSTAVTSSDFGVILSLLAHPANSAVLILILVHNSICWPFSNFPYFSELISLAEIRVEKLCLSPEFLNFEFHPPEFDDVVFANRVAFFLQGSNDQPESIIRMVLSISHNFKILLLLEILRQGKK